jgi:hypothetical protein
VDPVVDPERPRAGVQEHAGGEVVTQFVSKPDQVAGHLGRWRCARLDLEGNDPAIGGFEDKIEFMSTVFLAKVVHGDLQFGYGQLGAELRHHERGSSSPASAISGSAATAGRSRRMTVRARRRDVVVLPDARGPTSNAAVILFCDPRR